MAEEATSPEANETPADKFLKESRKKVTKKSAMRNTFTPESSTSNTEPIDNLAVHENSDFNPLTEEPVIKRDYTNPVQEVTDNGGGNQPPIDIPRPSAEPTMPPPIQSSIPEPTFAPPSAQRQEEAKMNAVAPEPLNPSLQTDEQRRLAAEQFVDMGLEVYEKAHTLGRKFVKIDDEKLTQLFLEDKLNPRMQIPVDENNSVGVKEFFESINKGADEMLVLDEDFKNKVRPVAIRVCEKRGVGMTDEQYLIFLLGQDIATKVASAIGLKKTINNSLKMMMAQYEVLKTQQPTQQQTKKAQPIKDNEVHEVEVMEDPTH